MAASTATAAALAGCATGAGQADRDRRDSRAQANRGSAESYAQRCGVVGAAATRLRAADRGSFRVRPSPGSSLPAAVIGRGGTTVVLLHQVSGGSCGWSPVLAAAARPGLRFVVPDLCGSRPATCTDALVRDQVAQVAALVEATARRFPGRLVLVGASMGGSIALHAVARGLRVDAVADLSGPDGWFEDGSISDDVRRIHVPVLLAYDPGDDPMTFRTARRLATRWPGRVRFVATHEGHGWDIPANLDGTLTTEGRTLVRFVRGSG